ncbi:MAG: Cytidine deaminase, partial [uncultured Nocardioidaceae bacterium]
ERCSDRLGRPARGGHRSDAAGLRAVLRVPRRGCRARRRRPDRGRVQRGERVVRRRSVRRVRAGFCAPRRRRRPARRVRLCRRRRRGPDAVWSLSPAVVRARRPRTRAADRVGATADARRAPRCVRPRQPPPSV